ncbi:MAG: protein translocase subunit SecD, partial [Sciscionella sp.]|nr:protein translocase subunit SecD [Sciscionella sp.]
MPPSAGHIRPARYLLTFAALVVLLYVLVFATGDHKPTPKLGIDLSGGTRVTLTARTDNGQPPSKDELNQAQQIIQRRVNGLGVAGTEVLLQGNNIIITVPGDSGSQAKSLGETAKLGFREVYNEVQASPPSSSAPASGASSSAKPSAGAASNAPTASKGSTSPAPQGRPAPAIGDHAAAPTSAQPPSSGAAAPSTPASTSATASSGSSSGGEDPEVVKQIQQAKKIRQDKNLIPANPNSPTAANQQAQQAAIASLNCAKKDPLVGNDDPTLPLVACSQDGQTKYVLGPVFLNGTEIDSVNSGLDPNGAGYVVDVTFKSGGAKTWADFTSANVGKQTAVVLDTQVVSAPQIKEAITGGNTQISGGQGGFSQTDAQNLTNVLKYGSLPLSFDSSNAETVSATLGLSSLRAGLIAGGIGLALVVVYSLFYYRALGALTVISLGLSGLTVYAVLVLLGRWIGFSLDLAGVAGFIIAIGITADSFVIFFERLKDEVREGRTFRSAVPRAWVRARRTILSADAVSFLAAVVLYVIATADVQGFAFTLGMSTLLDLLVVFLVTHPLVTFASRSKTLSAPRLSGLGAVQRIRDARRAARP